MQGLCGQCLIAKNASGKGVQSAKNLTADAGRMVEGDAVGAEVEVELEAVLAVEALAEVEEEAGIWSMACKLDL